MLKYEVIRKEDRNEVESSSLNAACIDAICGNGICGSQNIICGIPVVFCKELGTCKCPEECPTLQLC